MTNPANINTMKSTMIILATVLALVAAVLVQARAEAVPAQAPPSGEDTISTRYLNTTYGRPGGVYAYQVQGLHYDACTSHTQTCYFPWVYAQGPVVYRSPATAGKQRVAAAYLLQRWDGNSWAWYRHHYRFGTIYAGHRNVRMPPVDFLRDYVGPAENGYYRVLMTVRWTNANTGKWLGRRDLEFVQRGDYVCNTRFPCNANNGWVQLADPYP